jgi:adenylyl cyclase-associated protein
MSLDDPHSPKHVGSAAATPEPAAPVPVNTVAPPAPPAAPSLPPQIEDFDALINGDVRSFVDLGEKIGGLVAEQVSNLSLGLPSCVRL